MQFEIKGGSRVDIRFLIAQTNFSTKILLIAPKRVRFEIKNLKLKGECPVDIRFLKAQIYFLRKTSLRLQNSVKDCSENPFVAKHLKLKGGSPVGFR